MNQFKTFLLMVLLTLILVFIGDAIASREGMVIGLAVAIITNFASYFFSDKIVLASYGAQEVDYNHRLYKIVSNLCMRANLPIPKVCIVNDPSPNAFATGRDPKHAAVCATSGILNILNDDELEGVLAHELSHIKNRDILLSTIAAGIVGVIGVVARIGFIFGGRDSRENNGCATILLIMIGSFAATLIQLWISRTREYMADESGAKMCGKPWALADALGKLASGISARPMENARPETQNMFIVNPVKPIVKNLFSTHPPIEDRIKKLREMKMI